MKTELVMLKLSHLLDMGETDAQQNGLRMRGPGFCLLADGEPVAAGGILRLWDNVGKAWTIHTERARDSALIMRRIQRHVVHQIPLVRDAMGLERLEAETLMQPKFCSWLSHLGFLFEGEMRKYRAGETHARFAWIRGGA